VVEGLIGDDGEESLVSILYSVLSKEKANFNCCGWIKSAILIIIGTLVLILGIPLTAIAFIFDALHAFLYVLLYPEVILNQFAKASVSADSAEDIMKILTAQRSLFHAFSPRVPCTLSACVRLTVLYPYWLLPWFCSTCWKYLKMSVESVRKLCCCSGRKQEPISGNDDVKYIFTEFKAWTYNGSDNLWASFMETLWTDIESHFGRDAVRRHRASIALSSEKDSDDIETKTRKRDEALLALASSYLPTLANVLLKMATQCQNVGMNLSLI